jgi:[protein-PII] uridylyltransferase
VNDDAPFGQVSLRPKPSPAILLQAARRELSDEILRGEGGSTALERYAARIDALLQQLSADAPPAQGSVVLAALGGYGRRHLCLYSDIDLLVVFGGPLGDRDEQYLRALLHPLWDAGLVVGHQVREIDEFFRLEVDNPEFLLALVDARPLTGDESLFGRFAEAFHLPETHAYISGALERLIEERHALFNDTLYQLEPDIKDAPGALRDISAIRTIASLTDPALLRQGPEEPARLTEAEDFYLRVRSILHLEARRNQNVLTHALQERAAELLGYPGTPQQRVERLMGDYFRHARIVTRALEWARRSAPLPVGINVGRTSEGIRFIDRSKAAIQPATWLTVFQAAIDAGCGVANDTLVCMRQHADRFAVVDFFPKADHRAALLRFLKPKPGLYERLSEMHDCGLLGRMLPPFQAITYRVVRDFYHKYTVDEHTLLTIRNLERLTAPSSPGRERFASLLQDLEAPELLVLALLFHDVGKWREDDHASESVRMARQMFEVLELPPDAVDLVEFLISNHLRMSQVAFRRDTEDPEIVRHFAALVGVEERLKMLCLLTLADVEAVSLETLTPWKEELLWRLYVDTYNHLTLGYGDDLIQHRQADTSVLFAERPPDMSEAQISAFLEGLPRRYLQLFGRDAIYRHIRLSSDMRQGDVHLWLEPKTESWELTVVTHDRPLLFSNICGVLSSFGMDILRGHALTNANGVILDVFQFSDAERFLELNADARDTIFRALNDVVAGLSSVTDRLRGREQSLFHRRASRFKTVVHCDNLSSRRYTILEIVADDALGLLYRISRVISQHGCEVSLVLISTEGHKAIDVFHITKGEVKLSEAEQRAVADDLQRMLEES